MPRSKRPEHTRMNASRSRCARSMPACTLNTWPENGASTGRSVPSESARADGAGASRRTVSSSAPTPKLGSAAPNSTGVHTPARKASMSRTAPISSSSSSSSRAVRQASPSSRAARSAGTRSSIARVAPPGVRRNRVNAPSARPMRPRKSPAAPTGQVSGAGRSPMRCSTSSSSSSGSRPGRSHLLTNVITGMRRCRHTSNSLSVCASRPFAESSSMTAPSTAASTR